MTPDTAAENGATTTRFLDSLPASAHSVFTNVTFTPVGQTYHYTPRRAAATRAAGRITTALPHLA